MFAAAFRRPPSSTAGPALRAGKERRTQPHTRVFPRTRVRGLRGATRRVLAMGLEEASGAEATEAERRSGRCFCGKVGVILRGAPHAVSICHCVNCRKLSGAPFTAQALCRAHQVEVMCQDEIGKLVGYASSQAVERFRCPECWSPVYASLGKGKMAAVPLSILTDNTPGPLKPTHHMYYADRIVDCQDDLPKFVKSAARSAEMWTGD